MILINVKLKPGILNQIILRQLDVSLSLIIKTYTQICRDTMFGVY